MLPLNLSSLFQWLPFSITAVLGILFLYGVNRFFAYQLTKNIGKSVVVPQFIQFFLSVTLLIVLILNLPIPEGIKGQLLSLLGILLTAGIALSSTTFLGNLMAGLMVRGLDKFKSGDFIRVNDIFGKVTQVGLLHTEIQTEDRDLCTLPNLYLVNNPVKVILSSGTLLSEEISLGYDISRVDIEKVMLKSAHDIGLKDPFMHIRQLGDFSITYRISGFLDDVKSIITKRAKLKEALLDNLHRSRIEIVSPSFMNQRVFDSETQFIAKDKVDDIVDNVLAEEIIFDIAKIAETKEKVKEKITLIEQEIVKVKEDEQYTEEHRTKRIETLESRKKLLLEYLDKKNGEEISNK
jgi:small conductance mechanosensitive channel